MCKISIVIPVYKVEDCIEKSLTSALNQTYPSIEYLIIDDCSPDHSIEKVENIIKDHYRRSDIKIIRHNKNLGLSAARNTGLNNSSGEYVFFMDSDDEIIPECIELHFDSIKNSHADFTIADTRIIGKTSIHISDLKPECLDEIPLIAFLKNQYNVSAWNKLYRRDFLVENDILFKDGLLHEDILFSYNTSKAASKVSPLPVSTYKYIIRQGSITTSKNKEQKILDLIYIACYINDDKVSQDVVSFKNNYINKLKFNIALLLLNYGGSFSSANMLYNKIKGIRTMRNNIYSLLLVLPFFVFYIFLWLPYSIYKFYQRI